MKQSSKQFLKNARNHYFLCLIEELKALKFELESSDHVKSFHLYYESEGDDEGGSYKRWIISNVNNYSINFEIEYADMDLNRETPWANALKESLFQDKIKQTDFNEHLIRICFVLSEMTSNLEELSNNDVINIDIINQEIKHLEKRVEAN